MRVIILEDEVVASRGLTQILKKMNPHIEVVAVLESVQESVDWIKHHESPDLAFFDIQLADDTSFEVFKKCQVSFPVIFVTAYDHYLLQAFEHNSIHYLLKPINKEKIKQALDKFADLKEWFLTQHQQTLIQTLGQPTPRILVRKGLEHVSIEQTQIAYIFTEHKISFVKTTTGENYMADHSLSQLAKDLPTTLFFRVNRQYLVNIGAIKSYRSVEQSKIRLELLPSAGQEVIIGKEQAVNFRKWIKNQ
jgi:two-component system LytT family response regulator